jgi:hypothetical protein
MRPAVLSLGLLLALAATAHLAGCMRKASEPALDRSETDPRLGDPLGYYEQQREGIIYVVGSIQSLDKVRAGKPPPTVSAGFSRAGQAVFFETNNAGLTQRLMAEYERRHGLTSGPPR